MKLLLVAFLCCFAAANAQAQRVTLIHAGEVLTTPGKPPLKAQTIIIENGLIQDVVSGYRNAEEYSSDATDVVDLRNAFLLPGLIDAHVHITWLHNPNEQLEQVTDSDAFVALAGAKYANDTLSAGFTTVRDLGGRNESVFALRDAIAAGLVPGPQIVASGMAITPSGGASDYAGFRADVYTTFNRSHICDGADDCRRAVRHQVKLGADVIKFTATGGVTAPTDTGTGQQFTDEEIRAIVETAHNLGRKAAAHAHQRDGIVAALNAGADSIEHGMWADDQVFELFKSTNAWFVPTVYGIEYVGDTPEKIRNGPWGYLPPVIMKKLLAIAQQPRAVLRSAIRNDVRIAMGTDAVIFPHGMNAGELVEYVKAGMSEMEAIETSTTHAAELLGLAEKVGMIEPGKDADLVATRNSPLQDITELQRIQFVMYDGRVWKQ